jgi:hypothetical protein
MQFFGVVIALLATCYAVCGDHGPPITESAARYFESYFASRGCNVYTDKHRVRVVMPVSPLLLLVENSSDIIKAKLKVTGCPTEKEVWNHLLDGQTLIIEAVVAEKQYKVTCDRPR